MTKIWILSLFIALEYAFSFVAVNGRNGLQRLHYVASVSQRLASKNGENGEESTMSEAERMAAVRILQNSFYATSTKDDVNQRPSLVASTGIMTNLPLWRVGWVEVPGRTNCLNVHEGQYTHMFETILRGPQPWYFGHLHLPGGFKMTRTGESRFLLKNWRDEAQDDKRFDSPIRSAVVGCLMQITDYRRLEDGRLCLFVQALDRFVVDKVVQEFPYSIADVQMLPDNEEMPDGLEDENFVKLARGAAVQESFQFHSYEFDNTKLPILKSQEYTSSNSINAAAIGKLLPFASYSLNESRLDDISPKDDERTHSSSLEGKGFSGGSPPLEKQLQRAGILGDPPRLAEASKRNVDLDGLETLLWLAVEDLTRKTGFVLPAELLAPQPPHMDYLDLAPPEVDFVHVEDSVPKLLTKYPEYRRQKPLRYSLPAILEDTRIGEGMRQAYLNTPSTKARLEAVLARFEDINASLEDSQKNE